MACLKRGRDADDAVACIRAEYPYQHLRLDQAYRRLASRMGPSRRAPLDDEQERWLRWRDARCGREEIDMGMAACVIEMDADRATELEERMAGFAG
nr:lysozyme inhibitor LprI family protein [Frateuria flava]